jgi:hypothetical protein
LLILGLLVGLAIPILLGNLILYFLDSKKVLEPAENLTLSFLLGYPAVTLLIFWSFFVNLPYRVFIVGGAITALYVLRIILLGKFSYVGELLSQLKNQIVQMRGRKLLTLTNVILSLLLILIVIKLSYVFIEACSKPEYSWDASAFWTMDGKSFYYLNQEKPGQLLKYFFMLPNYHPEYPKQIQIMHFWLFSWMGETNDQWSKIIFPISLGFFLILFYTSLREIRGNLGATMFTYFLFSSPLFLYLSTVGYADFTLSVYFSLGIIFFHRWTKKKQDVYFWLFSIFISLTSWVKLEGKPLSILGLVILLIYVYHNYNKSIRYIVTKVGQYLFILLIINLPWQLVVINNHIGTREKLASHLTHFFDLHSQIYIKLFSQGSWGIFWIAVVAAVLLYYKRLFKRENVYLAITFMLFYGIVLFIFQFTYDGYSVFEVSFNRVWLSVYPVTVFMLGCIVPKVSLGTLAGSEITSL